jgi:4-hydroxy-2-oxoheptanedioate aldolase
LRRHLAQIQAALQISVLEVDPIETDHLIIYLLVTLEPGNEERGTQNEERFGTSFCLKIPLPYKEIGAAEGEEQRGGVPMKSIRKRTLQGEFLSGAWLNLGSSVTAEIAGGLGFDWILIDLEHGAGDHQALLHQLQALEAGSAAPIVRIEWNDPPRFKRALDLGPSGIMVPYINNAEEARRAVASMRYPPRGNRGVARLNRGAGFGLSFEEYFSTSADRLLTVTQVETKAAIENVQSIAAVEGVDVLFVGPLDLTTSLGIPMQFTHPDFLKGLEKVADAARRHEKAAGILLAKMEQVPPLVDMGFTFIAVGSDGGLVVEGMKSYATALNRFKDKSGP